MGNRESSCLSQTAIEPSGWIWESLCNRLKSGKPSQLCWQDWWGLCICVVCFEWLGEEFEDIFFLTYTTGHDRPDTFIKAHAGIAVGPLCDTPVQYHKSNLLLCWIIRRFNAIGFQKQKITISPISGKSFFDLTTVWMIRWPQNTAQKQLFKGFEFFSKISRLLVFAFSPGFEHLLDNPQ